MNKDGSKVVLIALSVVCFILLYSTVAFYIMEEGEKGKKNALQKKFDEVTAVKQGLEAKLKEAEMLTVELKTRLKTQEETIDTMTKSIDEAKSENNRNFIKLQSRENEIRAMKTKLENEKAEKDSLLKKIEKANEDYLNLKVQLENMLKTKEEIDRKAKELVEKEGVSLGTIVVNEQQR